MSNEIQNTTAQPGFPRSFLVRFLCVYFVLYAFPFPLTALISIPLTLVAQLLSPFGVEIPMLAHLDTMLYQLAEMPFALLTVPLGKLLGLQVHLAPTGSGDTAHYFIKTLLIGGIASLFAAVWTWRRKGHFPDTAARWLHVWGRWWLATCMIQYGFIKIFGQQFHLPNAHELVATLGDYSPMHLAWAFLGRSSSYQAFAGFAELIPAILTLHRKSAMVGLLMLFGVLCNVFAMNLFFDIPVKMASGHYLLTSLALLAPYAPRIRAFVSGQSELPAIDLYVKPKRFSEGTWSKLSTAAGVGLVVAGFGATNLKARQMKEMTKPTPLAGRWDIESTTRDGLLWQDTQSYKSLAIDNIGRFSLFSFEGEKTGFGLEPSQGKGEVTLRYPFRRAKDVKPTFNTWTVSLEETTVQGPNNRPTSFQDRLSKIPVKAIRATFTGHWNGHDYRIVALRRPLPIEQPFRWIQEAPFQH